MKIIYKFVLAVCLLSSPVYLSAFDFWGCCSSHATISDLENQVKQLQALHDKGKILFEEGKFEEAIEVLHYTAMESAEKGFNLSSDLFEQFTNSDELNHEALKTTSNYFNVLIELHMANILYTGMAFTKLEAYDEAKSCYSEIIGLFDIVDEPSREIKALREQATQKLYNTCMMLENN